MTDMKGKLIDITFNGDSKMLRVFEAKLEDAFIANGLLGKAQKDATQRASQIKLHCSGEVYEEILERFDSWCTENVHMLEEQDISAVDDRLFAFLKDRYKADETQELVTHLENLVGFRQQAKETPMDMLSRFDKLLIGLMRIEPQLNLKKLADGKLAGFFLRSAIGNDVLRQLVAATSTLEYSKVSAQVKQLSAKDLAFGSASQGAFPAVSNQRSLGGSGPGKPYGQTSPTKPNSNGQSVGRSDDVSGGAGDGSGRSRSYDKPKRPPRCPMPACASEGKCHWLTECQHFHAPTYTCSICRTKGHHEVQCPQRPNAKRKFGGDNGGSQGGNSKGRGGQGATVGSVEVAAAGGPLLAQKIMVVDTGASQKFITQGTLDQYGLVYSETPLAEPITVHTAGKAVIARSTVQLDCALPNKDGEQVNWSFQKILKAETEDPVSLLVGMDTVRLQGGVVHINMNTGVVEFPVTGSSIQCKVANNGLMYYDIQQPACVADACPVEPVPPTDGEPLAASDETAEAGPPANRSKDVSVDFILTPKKSATTTVTLTPDQMHELCGALHCEVGHAGVTRTLQALTTRYRVSPTTQMRRLVSGLVKECKACIINKPLSGLEFSYGSLDANGKKHTLAADLVDYNSNKSARGHRYVLSLICEGTRFVVCVPLMSKEALDVLAAFKSGWLQSFGTPRVLRFDPGNEFKGGFLDACKALGIQVIQTPVGHPQSNSICERMHRELHVVLRTELQDQQLTPDQWDLVLEKAVTKLNRRPVGALGVSPYERMFGQAPHIPSLQYIDTLCSGDEKGDVSAAQYTAGQVVYYRDPNKVYPKLEEQRDKFVVMKVLSNSTYLIKPHADSKSGRRFSTPVKVHVGQLRPAPHSDSDTHVFPQPPHTLPTKPTPPTVPAAAVPPTAENGSEPVAGGGSPQLVVWADQQQRKLYLGEQLSADEKAGVTEVHAYGTHSKSARVCMRKYAPGWDSTLTGLTTYSSKHRRPAKSVPELCSIPTENIVQRGVVLDADGRLQPKVCDDLVARCPGFALAVSTYTNTPNVLVSSAVCAAVETTHQRVRYRSLSAEDKLKLGAARQKELAKFDKYDVYERVPITEADPSVTPINMMWVDTAKLMVGDSVPEQHDSEKRQYKCRLVMGGHLDEDKDQLETSTVTCTHDSVRLLCQIAQAFGGKVKTVDVTNAYLQSEINRLVYGRPPAGHPDAGKYVWRLKKAVYGLADSGKLFEDTLLQHLKALGFERTVFEAVYMKKDEITHRPEYLDSLSVPEGPVPEQPLPDGCIKSEDKSAELTNGKDIKAYRKLLGRYAYVASRYRPDLAFSASYLAKYNQAPTKLAVELLHGCVRFAKATRDAVITMRPPEKDRIELDAYVDASFGSHHSPYAQTGWVLLHKGAPLMWVSHAQKRVARSTCKAEVIALDECLDRMVLVRNFMQLLWDRVDIVIKDDAADVLALLDNTFPRPSERSLIPKLMAMQDKSLVVPALACRDAFDEAKIKLQKVESHKNVADCLTKPMAVNALLDLMLTK